MQIVRSENLGIAGFFGPVATRVTNPSSLQAIAARLKILREALDLNQASWCRLIGVETNTWNNYERGRRRISVDEARRVRTSTGATLDYIYEGDAGALPVQLAMKIQGRHKKSPSGT